MNGHRPEVADVIRDYGAAYLKRYRPSREQWRVLNAVVQCRTAALGGHLNRCERCAHEVPVYNSCRNRHCPKCQGAARAAWVDARQAELLDVEYFHVVFTLPSELAPLALQNRRAVYGMLFRAASETLLTLARDPKHLGAELGFHGSLRDLDHPQRWKAWLQPLRDKDWVVYAKPPFGGPQQVLKYLARYTHRVAISNHRLVAVEDAKVTFRWKDYAHGHRQRTMSLEAVEFLRRFLLHVLPKGFVRVRYYGFLANRHRAEKLARARKFLDGAKSSSVNDDVSELKPTNGTLQQQVEELELCPQCKLGRLLLVRVMARPARAIASWSFDSS